MRTRLAVVGGVMAMALAGAGFVALANAKPADTMAKPQTVTIRGEVVDLGCYMRMGAKGGAGAGHEACAIACAKAGLPRGIVDAKTGQVYLSLGKSLMGAAGQDIDTFMAKKVVVTGEVFTQKGIQSIAAVSIKEEGVR